MHSKQRLILTLLAGIFLSLYAAAQTPQPVSDTELQQITRNMESTLSNQIYPSVMQQTENIRAVNKILEQSLTGVSSAGSTNNFPQEQQFRNWTPTSADLARMVEQGLQTGSLADQITYYNQKFQIPSIEQLSPANPNNPLAEYSVFSAISTNAALSVADKGFDNATQIQEQINFLYKQIDQQRTLKQSQDLNSVILLKIAALQADLMRIQSQQLKMQAVSNAEGNSKRTYMTQFVQDIR